MGADPALENAKAFTLALQQKLIEWIELDHKRKIGAWHVRKPTADASLVREAALTYAAKFGWSVLPLRGKAPATPHGYKDATNDPEQIKKLFPAGSHFNVGVATGTGLLVLDVDPHNGGDESLAALEAKHGALPHTIRALTGRGNGGTHYYFRCPPAGVRSGSAGDGLDVKAHGGFVVAPPSLHPDTGQPYLWDVGAHPDETPLADAPEWLLKPFLPGATSVQCVAVEGADAQDTVLGTICAEMGWLGSLHPNGIRDARCPLHEQHSDGRGKGADSSCAILPATSSKKFGAPCCLHQSHRPLAFGDIIDAASPEVVARAFKKYGLNPPKREPSTFAPSGVVASSGLTALSEGATLEEVGACLAKLATDLAGAPPQAVALAREAAVKAVKATGAAEAPARLVDAYLEQRPKAEDGAGDSLFFAEPNPWHEAVSTAAILDEVSAALGQFLILPSGAADAVALWILHTHALDAAQISPRLAIVSPAKRCGKTTLETFLAMLVRRPLQASNLTAAALFRIVEAQSPTLLVDEADTFLKDNDDLRGVLNAGHNRQSAKVIRCSGEDFTPCTFSVWAPVAIAAIGKLPDTLFDRSVIIPMRRKTPNEKVKRFRRTEQASLAPLRRKIERWIVDYEKLLRAAIPVVPEALNDRAHDNWEPLLAIASLAGETWKERAGRAALALSGEPPDDGDAPLGEALLSDVRDIFAKLNVDRLSTYDLVIRLCNLAERPWKTIKRGGELDAHVLGRMLRRFEVRSTTIRPTKEPNKPAKGYTRVDFEDAWARYLPPVTPLPIQVSPIETVTLGTTAKPNGISAKNDPLHGPSCNGSKTTEKPNDSEVVPGVTAPDPPPSRGKGGRPRNGLRLPAASSSFAERMGSKTWTLTDLSVAIGRTFQEATQTLDAALKRGVAEMVGTKTPEGKELYRWKRLTP